MSRRNTQQLTYTAIRIEGGLIPAEQLIRLTLLENPEETEQTDAHYQIARGLKLRDEIARDFKIALTLWRDFQVLRARQDVRLREVTLREWLIPLLKDVLHFQDVTQTTPLAISGREYPIGYISHAGRVPLVLAGVDEGLDSSGERFGETNPDTGKTRRRSPFMLAQEALNAIDSSLWAITSNGLTLRILRDNPSLTRPAYVEVDLERLFSEELLADFSALWLLAHSTRFGKADSTPSDCPWERWRNAGQQLGVTVRGQLRYQVAEALRALGTGFLSHPANQGLRAALQNVDSGYDRQTFFEELLRLVYRIIFLATVEDRRDRATGERLVFLPDATEEAKSRYIAGYSLTWLRERAVRRNAYDRHTDLWQALTVTFKSLGAGQPLLGLPALGGLFANDQCPTLDDAELGNSYLLSSLFQLGWFRADGGLSRVNYRDMGPEELGSVYESLLELVPDPQGLSSPITARLAFVGDDDTDASTRGNSRKLTGSYYTPDSLVQELIKSALEPVIEQTVQANPERPVDALLSLTICDPACGSGHFLLSAARRLADEVALHRALVEREGGAPTPTDYRHALRDVVSRCIYGVDKNPMAIQLAKTALWLEAYSPDRPLTFIDHHLQVGDALLGVLDPKVLENGIPDEAYNALSGDDKSVASALKKQNKIDMKSWRNIASGDWFTRAGFTSSALSVETLGDATPEELAAKKASWSVAQEEALNSKLARLADTYVAAFLAPKLADTSASVPLSGYLWGVLNEQPLTGERAKLIENTAQSLCRQYGVFHWWLAFPQVAAMGGFSVMLGNPPWERIKLQEEEFFATRSPLVAAAKNKAERSKRIEWLRQGVLLHNIDPDLERAEGLSPPNSAEMSLYASFIAARRGAEAASLYAHDSRRYPLTGVGDVNTYALFAETLLQATSPSGRAGFIVPTGIATDDSTKAYFGCIASQGRLISLFDFENSAAIFPGVHRSYKFSLLTLGVARQAEFVCFATQVEQLQDVRRRFVLTPDEFGLINPNTRTCPIFRSERDAELTKKLYRVAPVLIREQASDENGSILNSEENPWGIRFQTMFHMSNDSGLFADSPTMAGEHKRLPLYEAKMIHQFDHRWATYVDAASGMLGEVETADVSDGEKAHPDFVVRPRYWVDEREVLARIARVPTRVATAWLKFSQTMERSDTGDHYQAYETALADLLLSLAQWVAGELFHRAAGSAPSPAGWTAQQAQPFIAATEQQIKARFSRLNEVLKGEGLTTKKALAEFPRWAGQNQDSRLGDDELAALQKVLLATSMTNNLLDLLDNWMDKLSPSWLLVMRGVARATDERTFITSISPRLALGNSAPVLQLPAHLNPNLAACLMGSLNSLVVDFAARFKVGGINMNFFLVKQFPVLTPDRYSEDDIAFIVPRVLELTYSANDLRDWGQDLSGHDPRPLAEQGRPFAWNPLRRAQLRAELDAYYARLYGLDRDELRYILDPKDVMGHDYPSETFRVLKEGEIRIHGEYRTRRLVLEAWDKSVCM